MNIDQSLHGAGQMLRCYYNDRFVLMVDGNAKNAVLHNDTDYLEALRAGGYIVPNKVHYHIPCRRTPAGGTGVLRQDPSAMDVTRVLTVRGVRGEGEGRSGKSGAFLRACTVAARTLGLVLAK